MRRGKLRWVLAGVAVVALLAVAAVVLWPYPNRVTRQNFDRIRLGMSLAEVEAILGPPGDYRTGDTVVIAIDANRLLTDPSSALRTKPGPATAQPEVRKVWEGDKGEIAIYFQAAGVSDKHFRPALSSGQSAFDRLRWRIRRQRQKWLPDD
jgi:hypothetical protein